MLTNMVIILIVFGTIENLIHNISNITVYRYMVAVTIASVLGSRYATMHLENKEVCIVQYK